MPAEREVVRDPCTGEVGVRPAEMGGWKRGRPGQRGKLWMWFCDGGWFEDNLWVEQRFSRHQFHSLGGMKMANGFQVCVCVCVLDWKKAADETGDTCLWQTVTFEHYTVEHTSTLRSSVSATLRISQLKTPSFSFQIWLKGFQALIKCFLRRIYTELYR